MRKIIAGNWKMNLNISDSFNLVNQIIDSISLMTENIEVIIAPSYLAIEGISKILKQKNSKIKLAVQDIHWQEQGAYTGKIAASMLSDVEVSYSLVGHSEQRLYFSETDENINKKVKQLLKNNLTPIVCIGETLEQREQGKFKSVIIEQLKKSCFELSSLQMEKLIIAYEPVWAIGTGKIPSFDQIAEVHQTIKDELGILCEDKKKIPPVLYGGSVKPENSAEIMKIKNVDGVLVGGASLESEKFNQIISSVL